jgi:pimeloyl-ACP methyl ester carboxylesterase
MTQTLDTVTSADGTAIAFERSGDGPPVILIGGAFNDRSTVAGLASALAPRFTAVTYDRRGRGDSTDNSASSGKSASAGNSASPGNSASTDNSASAATSVGREIEDLVALIDRLGGSASLFGHSSGACLALEAAMAGAAATRVVVYEPPYVLDDARPRPGDDIGDRLRALIALGQRDEAVALFMTESVGVPAEMVRAMQAGGGWGFLVRLAHTLPYDAAVCGSGLAIPADRLAELRVPVLAVNGSESWPWIAASTQAVADAVPESRYVSLEGQDHSVLHHPEALCPVLVDFLS